MKPLAPNTLLQNRYLVVHLIGKGGMGDVYLAVDQRLGSAVALKRTFFADDELLGGAFEREARTLARLRHPVLPKVSDHFTEGGEQYLVMEHISGEDLSKRLEAAQKPFPFSWVLFWADQLLDALSYLHTHEPPIIHRDIKPQNLKLTDENHIILLDFGLSKNTVGETRANTSSGSTGSTTGSVVGYTPHYAPMEQIRGTGTNPRSDIYSLSATIYQLLTNVVPADALSRADSMLNGLPDTIKPIYEINAEVSKTVSDVILKGMQVSQEKRFGSAREMQKILRDAYAQMQSAMSAQTMTFNLQDVQTEQTAPPIPVTQQKTEVLNISPSEINPVPINTPPPSNITSGFADSAPKMDSGSLSNQETIAEPNFDATLRMDTPLVLPQSDAQSGAPEARQSDVKTEVFLANEVAAAIPPTPSFVVENKTAGREENFNETENFSLTNDFSQTGLGNESVGAGGAPAFYTNSQAGRENEENFEDFSATRNFSTGEFADEGEARNFDSQPQPPVQPVKPAPLPAKKGSGGKILAVIAGLGALLILGLAAAGGGWWYYKNHMAVVETPTPTPRPTTTFTPTPTPTPDTNVNASDNSNSGNSNSGVSNGDAKNGTINKTPTPIQTPTPVNDATPKPTPTVRVTPNRPPPTPVVKPTKQTPNANERTTIKQ